MKKILILLAAVAAFASCSLKLDSVVPQYSSIKAPPIGGEMEFKVYASGNWSASIQGNVDVRLSSMFGNGNADLKIKVEENKDTVARAGAIVFTCGKSVQSTVIYQDRFVKAEIKAERISSTVLTYAGGGINYAVTSNATWVASCESKDVKIERTGNDYQSDLYISFPANNTDHDITYEIIVKTIQGRDDVQTVITETVPAKK